MQRKTDPRVIRTRHMLRGALIALILDKGYDAISIQDITDKAGLRRATFYLHYKDKEELLFSILSETFDELVCQIDQLQLQLVSPEAEMAMNRIIFKHAQENADLYRSILGGHGASTTIRYIREYLAQAFLKELEEHQPEQTLVMPVDVLANYTATIKLNMAIWWLEQGMPYSPEQMAEMCTQLTLNGTRAVFEPKHTETELSPA
ncbi:MAG: TetR/AcrR family transcriptional regulator [Anaerolineae bacterium]|nr:TetR/AcrR family transcriptional regulator [Anaerolineae bacterium]